jgi:hypothetical protein
MKSFAAYYALVALSDAQQDAEHHRRAAMAARSPRPSILGRARMRIATARPGRQPEPTASAA